MDNLTWDSSELEDEAKPEKAHQRALSDIEKSIRRMEDRMTASFASFGALGAAGAAFAINLPMEPSVAVPLLGASGCAIIVGGLVTPFVGGLSLWSRKERRETAEAFDKKVREDAHKNQEFADAMRERREAHATEMYERREAHATAMREIQYGHR